MPTAGLFVQNHSCDLLRQAFSYPHLWHSQISFKFERTIQLPRYGSDIKIGVRIPLSHLTERDWLNSTTDILKIYEKGELQNTAVFFLVDSTSNVDNELAAFMNNMSLN